MAAELVQIPMAAVGGDQGGPQVSIPSIYFNGFANALSQADISSVLTLDGQPVARLSMSYTTAKTLVKMLGELVSKLEDITGREVMTTEDITAALQKSGGGDRRS